MNRPSDKDLAFKVLDHGPTILVVRSVGDKPPRSGQLWNYWEPGATRSRRILTVKVEDLGDGRFRVWHTPHGIISMADEICGQLDDEVFEALDIAVKGCERS